MLDKSLSEHFASFHVTNCCNQKFSSLKWYPQSRVQSHNSFFRANTSYESLKSFYTATVQGRPRLLWEKNVQIMLFPESPNSSMPPMYSEAFETMMMGLEPSAVAISELLQGSKEYEQEVRNQIAGRWTKLTSHYLLVGSAALTTGIAAIYQNAVARLQYIVNCAFTQEVQGSVRENFGTCRKCRDLSNHSATPDLCILRDLCKPQILELRSGVINRYIMADYGGVWVGAGGSLYEELPVTNISLLNLSDTKPTIRYPTHIIMGRKTVVTADGTLAIRFHDFFNHLEEVLVNTAKKYLCSGVC